MGLTDTFRFSGLRLRPRVRLAFEPGTTSVTAALEGGSGSSMSSVSSQGGKGATKAP
jgi:hypothetical protein